ncbi:hypothetical protein [Bradyrhizobium septentrionale]|uniref:Uncharacterized protein n=1 Tax=Bradyrhizobium septentrionale TaxID=1404411 RepID=A0A973W8B6_9BRAD|nr:hypothetical protein [Bradyrhizobium septentrionale]UGY17737.1 hypothetical protein HAP48_0010075 [Bradyrhizobium septentrionale]UGY26472.1 hypothetical protein HU675_0006790 [Bradyrhizobium septentrionale]
MSIDHIAEAVRETGTRAELLRDAARKALITRLLERLGVDVASHASWDRDTAPRGRLRPDGWELISKYVGAKQCVLFEDRAREIWRFRDGSDLLQILDNCPPMEFYICDEEASYLLCSNHHDYLIGWGAASSWVDQLDET